MSEAFLEGKPGVDFTLTSRQLKPLREKEAEPASLYTTCLPCSVAVDIFQAAQVLLVTPRNRGDSYVQKTRLVRAVRR